MTGSAVLLLFAASDVLAQTTGTIAGTVTDAITHQPIREALVEARNSLYKNARTGSDGTFVVKDVPAGEIRLRIALKGYREFDSSSAPNASMRLAPGEFLKRDFELHPLARVSGKIVDRDTGELLSGSVYMGRRQTVLDHPQWALPYNSEVEGPDNEFDMIGVEPGDYVLVVSDVSRTSATKTADVPTGYWNEGFYPGVPAIDMAAIIHIDEGERHSLDVRLPAVETYSAAGVIEVPSGHENDELQVWLQKGGLGTGVKTPVHQYGPFGLDGLAPGTYGISARLGEGAETQYDRAVFAITDHDVNGLKLTFQPAASVTTRLRMAEEGVPVLGAVPISRQLQNMAQGMQKAAQAGLPPPNFKPVDAPIVVSLDRIGGAADISRPWWAAGAVCIGWICSPGSPVGMFAVNNGPRTGPGSLDNIPQADYWPFINRLPDGYAVSRILFQDRDLAGQPLALRGSGELTFVITSKPGAIFGTARDENQVPIPHAIVALAPDTFTAESDPRQIRRTETGNGGEFTFRNIAPGKYRAIVLTGDNRASGNDADFLFSRTGNSELVEVQAGLTAGVTLRPRN